MSTPSQARAALREIPSVDDLIAHFHDSILNAPYPLYLQTIRSTLSEIRREIQESISVGDISETTFRRVEIALKEISLPNLRKVINGTGIILHTGLGRAPLPEKLMKKVIDQLCSYTNLELDLKTGKRGERNQHVEVLINAVTGSEAALVVNNNAAAVLIMLNSLAEGKEVIISRGEQVEIGGSFRIPDVIRKSGCNMVEVGTTNKTHLADYQKAITKNTGAILVAHTSNYKVLGFTKTVELTELRTLAKKTRIPLILDLGSGAIVDFRKLNLPHEPTVKSYLKSGAGVVSFSGDKLLGGPQSGIICGKKTLIRKIHNNPLYRALRCDKLTFALLESILRSYLTTTDIQHYNLSMQLFLQTQPELLKMGERIIKKLPSKKVESYGLDVIQSEVEAGSGSLPLEKFPSAAIVFNGDTKASELSQQFRTATPSVLGFINGNRFHIDLKAIPADQEGSLVQAMKNVLQ